jgi:hypothetical protein
MSDNRVRIWFSLFVLAVFCVGLAGGMVIGRRMGPPPRGGGPPEFGPLGPPPGRPGPPPRMLLDRLDEVLQLTTDQRSKLEPIFEERRKRLETMHDDIVTRTEKEQREFQDEIRRVLIPDQLQRFQRWLDEAPRGRRGGRGPGPGREPGSPGPIR